jgi:hypothetical protein
MAGKRTEPKKRLMTGLGLSKSDNFAVRDLPLAYGLRRHGGGLGQLA